MTTIVCMDLNSHAGFSRVPGRFKELGAKVYGVGLEEGLLLKTVALDGRLRFPVPKDSPNFGMLATNMYNVAKQWNPDFVLIGDEILLRNFLEIRKRMIEVSASLRAKEKMVVDLLDQTLMDYESYTRIGQMVHLEKSGFPVPEYCAIESYDEVPAAYNKLGGTAYFKLSFESAGMGLAKLESKKDLDTAFDSFLEFGAKPDKDAPAILQAEVEGKEYVVSFAALKGELLGYVVIDVLERTYETGPSSVVKSVYRPDWEKPIEKLVRSMNFSGFGGLDVIESNTDELPFVIEVNARATHTLPYSKYLGVDLIGRFYEAISGDVNNVMGLEKTAISDKICAVFPQELYRDINSPYVKEAVFDVPWEDPLLMVGLLDQAGNIAPYYRQAYSSLLSEDKD